MISSEETADIELNVNGVSVAKTVPVRRHLVDFLRLDLNLTGSHLACEHGVWCLHRSGRWCGSSRLLDAGRTGGWCRSGDD